MRGPFTLMFGIVLALAPSAIAHAQEPRALTDLSLEELMRIDVERVFGASQRMQPVTEAPASVTIVTADDIARYGYRSLADILRSVRGLYVSDDRNYSYVGVRGFARSGDYNTRVLLLVNGHRMNDNVYDQAGIGADLGIDPVMFDRVEIIRGPASSLYGTNAFFAVVNVITRTGASLNGGSLALAAGTLGTQRAHAAFGDRLANGVDVAVSGTFMRSDGAERLYYPVFDTPATNSGVAEGLDGEEYGQVYGRVGVKNLVMTGAHGTRRKDVPAASFGTIFNEQAFKERTTDTRTMVDGLYEQLLAGARLEVRASFDRYAYDGVYPLPADDPTVPLIVNYDSAVGSRWGVDGRLTRTFRGAHTLTVGAEFFDNIQQNQTNSYDQPTEPGFALTRASDQGGVYVQDEIKVRRWLLLDGGLRYDRYQGTSRVTPRVAAVFTLSPHESFKYLYGVAFRAPNVYELDYHTMGLGNVDLRPESIDTHEIVWERYTRDWLRTSASAYWYDAKRLISLQVDPTTFDGLAFVNAGQARAEGLEVEAEVRLKRGVQGVASYALQRATDQTTGETLTNSPRHMVKFRASLPIPANRSVAAIDLQYLSSRSTLAGDVVAPATITTVTITERIGRGVELIGTIRNLFDQRYADPASDEHLQDSIPQDGRTFTVGVRWALPAR